MSLSNNTGRYDITYQEDAYSKPEYRAYNLPVDLQIPTGGRYFYQLDTPLLEFYKPPAHIRELVDNLHLINPMVIKSAGVTSQRPNQVVIRLFYGQDWYQVHSEIVESIEFSLSSWPELQT